MFTVSWRTIEGDKIAEENFTNWTDALGEYEAAVSEASTLELVTLA